MKMQLSKHSFPAGIVDATKTLRGSFCKVSLSNTSLKIEAITGMVDER